MKQEFLSGTKLNCKAKVTGIESKFLALTELTGRVKQIEWKYSRDEYKLQE